MKKKSSSSKKKKKKRMREKPCELSRIEERALERRS